jgi:hypothetical protein
MLEISIVKMFFFNLLRRKKFKNSLFFTKNSLSDIFKEIEKKYSITLIDSIFNSDRIKFFFKQFNIIKVSWKKLRGGFKKQKYLEKLQNTFLNFSLDDNEFNQKEGEFMIETN